MIQKQSKAPKILGFIALAFSVLAFICAFPIGEVFRCIETGNTINLSFLYSNYLSQFQCFLISLILPMALLLIPRENGRKKAVIFIVITAVVILTQIVGNVIHYLVSYVIDLGEYAYLVTDYTGRINGVRFLNTIDYIIRARNYFSKFSSVYRVMNFIDTMSELISNILYLLQPVLCLVGFITLLKKNKTLHQLEE